MDFYSYAERRPHASKQLMLPVGIWLFTRAAEAFAPVPGFSLTAKPEPGLVPILEAMATVFGFILGLLGLILGCYACMSFVVAWCS